MLIGDTCFYVLVYIHIYMFTGSEADPSWCVPPPVMSLLLSSLIAACTRTNAVTERPLNVFFSSEKNIPQAAIGVCLLIFMGSATLVTLFSICRPANKLSFKQGDAMASLHKRTPSGETNTEQMRKDWLIVIRRHYSLSATLTHFIWGYVLTRASCVFPAIALLLCTKVRWFIWLRQRWLTLPLSAPPLTDMFLFREAETLLSSQRSRLTKPPETHLVQSSRRRRHFQLPIWVLMIEIKTFTQAFDSLRVPRKTKHVKDVVAPLWHVDLSHPSLC